ncbi:ImmA/IrrE family metallo-endopeptidase [Paenibacillus xanthanilyticus]|uniref:ImmA/IrrE family metallo-endopeptidase n=1 Tax=Paenibacillus xanthanilyticus TaxID=1783531 RepID=A0ABV8KAP4_9BACL
MGYEHLLRAAEREGVDVYERIMRPAIKGLYGDRVIWINRSIPTMTEKRCVLAEELGHYHTSSGDILDQRRLENRKQEKRARNWAYEKLVPLSGIVRAYKAGVKGRYEMAEFLGVIEDFLDQAIKHYQEKYGQLTVFEEKYMIYFDPLGVAEMFE